MHPFLPCSSVNLFSYAAVCFSKGLQRSSRGYAYHYRKSKGPKKKFGRVRVGMYVLLKVPREVLRGTRINIETLGGLKRSLEGYA